MNPDQINGILRIVVPSVMSTFTGFALAHGFTNESWIAFSASVLTILATLVSVALSWHSHTLPVMLDAVAQSPDVHKVVVTPALAMTTPSLKVVAK
jgi:hypothetical protein